MRFFCRHQRFSDLTNLHFYVDLGNTFDLSSVEHLFCYTTTVARASLIDSRLKEVQARGSFSDVVSFLQLDEWATIEDVTNLD